MFTSNRRFSGSDYRMMSVKFYNDRLQLPMGWCQWTTYRKPPTASLRFTWPMTSCYPKSGNIGTLGQIPRSIERISSLYIYLRFSTLLKLRTVLRPLIFTSPLVSSGMSDCLSDCTNQVKPILETLLQWQAALNHFQKWNLKVNLLLRHRF